MKRSRLALAVLALGLLALGVMFLLELRRVPPLPATPTGRAEPAPLTDVAGPARRARQATAEQTSTDAAYLPPLPEPVAVPPTLMPDPAHPPQGTAPLAVPGKPVPPDPMIEPELTQDPTRGGRDQ